MLIPPEERLRADRERGQGGRLKDFLLIPAIELRPIVVTVSEGEEGGVDLSLDLGAGEVLIPELTGESLAALGAFLKECGEKRLAAEHRVT